MGSDTVLITGASGFLATHVIDAFLRAGYTVRGAVRSEEAAAKVHQTFPNFSGKLSFMIVLDITKSDAFDEAVRGVRGVIHTASPFQIYVDNNEPDLLQPTIEGTRNILRSAKK